MDLEAFQRLLTSAGQRALTAAVETVAEGADPVTAASRLRRTHDAALTSAALTQATLRKRAEAKFGDDAAVMYFTSDGLEQATRAEVAAHRARRISAAASPARILDVCCGIGGDLIALAREGCAVDAVDRDPLTVAVATANASALGLSDLVRVVTADAADSDPGDYDVLFADPARRGARGRVFDPLAYSPPWPTVLGLASRAKATCLKVAPGIPYEFIPEGAEAEWISYKGEVKEAALWLGRFAPNSSDQLIRRATMLPSGETLTALKADDLNPAGGEADAGVGVGPVGRYLYEPDGAAIRAHLVADIASMVGGHLLDPRIAYITGDTAVHTEWASLYEISDVMPFSLKRLRATLRERGVGKVTLKKRGSAVDIERLRRDLRLSGEKSAVVVLTRINDRPFMLICSSAA